MPYFMANDDDINENDSTETEESWQEEDDLIDDEFDEEEEEDDEDDEGLESYDETFDETVGTLRAFISALVDSDEKEDLLDLITELTLRHGEAIDLLNEYHLREKLDQPDHIDD